MRFAGYHWTSFISAQTGAAAVMGRLVQTLGIRH
jgi:hypothetical protein